MNRRELIKMSEQEVDAFLAHARTATCATIGPRGWPHLAPLWYVLRAAGDGSPGPRLWAWTYAKSQKVVNLERDPRATVQVEDGVQYDQLRGVVLECEVRLHREVEVVADVGGELMRRYSGPAGSEPPLDLAPEAQAAVDAQAPKRVALEFVERRRTSWDHGKLGGTY